MPARVSSLPPLSPLAIGKADRALRESLERSPRDATVRVVMTLGEPEERRRPGTPAARPAPARLADRRALIDARKRELEATFGAVLRSLEAHGLKVAGGGVTRAIVAEGKVADVARSLDLPLIRRAALDREWSRSAARGANGRRARGGNRSAAAKPPVRPTAAKRPSIRSSTKPSAGASARH